MIDNLKKRLAPPVFEDEEKTRIARLLNIISLSIIVLLSAFIIIRLIVVEPNITNRGTIANTILVLMLLVAQGVMRRGYVRTTSIIFVALGWLNLTYQAWFANGINDAAFIGQIIIILLANLLIGWQAGLVTTGLVILTGWVLAYAAAQGLRNPSISGEPFLDALEITLVFGAAAIVLALTTANLRNALTRARQSEKSLTQSNRELQTLSTSLENQVDERTRRLEIVAEMSGQLVSILNIKQLLTELVKQTQENFGYYHVQVYQLDDQRQKLTVIAGVGEAGDKMKAAGHFIPFNTPTSLVARAARTGQIVWEDNVRQAKDWLPNPLLPDTYSEMAVPIILDGQAIGVLDVQNDKIASLHEGDANLLRSLANQVAITIQNARNFERVETALAEAQTVQEQYIVRAWQQAKTAATKPHLYTRPGVTPLDETDQQALLARQNLAQSAPLLAEPIDLAEISRQTLIVPINLRQKAIGTLQLQAGDNTTPWGEDDLAIIETIMGQVAQSAENLRLFEETRGRAGREATIREITDKIRTATDLNQLMKITAEELGRRFSATHAQLDFGLATEAGSNDAKR